MSKKKISSQESSGFNDRPDALDAEKLYQDLRIHQAELEMQNDELRQAQGELETTQCDFFNLFQFAPVGYVILNEKNVITRSNIAFGELVNHRLESITGRHVFTFIETHDQSLLLQWLALARKEPRAAGITLRLRETGRHIRFNITFLGTKAHSQESGDEKLLLSLVDITEIEETRIEREATLGYLNTAIMVASLAWWKMDIVTGRVDFHENKTIMLGYRLEDFQGKHYRVFTDLIHPDDHEAAMTAMKRHFTGEAPEYEIEYRIKTAAGSYKWFYDFGKIISYDSEGKPLMITGIVRDITLEKKTRESLNRVKTDTGRLLKIQWTG